MGKQSRSRTRTASAGTPTPPWLAPAILAACVLVFYWTQLTSPSASIQWDAADMHYPLQKYFADRLLSFQLPFWTPYLFSGYPFLANPEVGAWYPPHWPFFLTGITPRVIQLELALHAFLACLGAYLLLRRLVSTRGAAVFGALAYGLSGFFAGHSSHIGLFCAAACFPWLLLAYRRAADEAPWRYAALGAMAGGCMILAGYAQTAMYGFLGLGMYALADMWTNRAAGSRRLLRSFAIVAAMTAGALALAAVQILPGLELVAHSIRAGMNFSKNADSVLQPRALLTLIHPDALGVFSGAYTGPVDITQYYFYGGLLLVPLALVGLWKHKLRTPVLFLLIPALWYMAGPDAGFYRLGALIPGLHSVRAPIQGWFVAALALAMASASGAAWVCERWRLRYLGVALTAILFLDVLYWNSVKNPLAYSRNSFQELYGAGEDLGREHVKPALPPLTRFEAPPRLTVMGPLEHPLDLKLESTYGYFALEPDAYLEYLAAMSRNPKLRDGLNVSRILNAKTGGLDTNPSVLPRAYFPRSVVPLNSLNETRQALDSLDPAQRSVVLAPTGTQQDPNATAAVVAADEQSCRIRYRTASPSLLKLSVAWFPGWRATVGTRDLPVLRVDHALMGAVVSGEGEVDFHFHSDYFAYGMIVFLLCAIALPVIAWRNPFSRTHPGPA